MVLFFSFQQRIDCNTASTSDLEFSSEFTLTITTSTKCTVRHFISLRMVSVTLN